MSFDFIRFIQHQTLAAHGGKKGEMSGRDAGLSGRSSLLILLACLLITGEMFSVPKSAQACPPGMIKTALDWSNPSLEDFSYFIESYVTHEKYRHHFDNYQSRFYALDFLSLERQGRGASVLFEVLDVKYNSRFQERMVFSRAGNGNWQYSEPDGNVRNVFSYMPTWLYVVQTYLRPAAMVGLPLLLVLLLVLRLRKKKNKKIFASKEPGLS